MRSQQGEHGTWKVLHRKIRHMNDKTSSEVLPFREWSKPNRVLKIDAGMLLSPPSR